MFGRRNRSTLAVGAVLTAGSLILGLTGCGGSDSDSVKVGLVTKNFGLKNLADDNPIAFLGEAGYQAELLMPGLRFKVWPVYSVDRFPWVQVPAGEVAL